MHNLIPKLILLLSFFSWILSRSSIPKIDVYIESLCPDCTSFIGSSFLEFHRYNIPNLAEVNFIPFGNASEEWDGSKWVFTCQHKENECYGNTIEACAINKMGRIKSYDLLICIENNIFAFSKDFDKVWSHCLGDSSPLWNEIKACVAGDEGNKLLHEMAQKTPKHDYVPWITVDDVHDVAAENEILLNMVDYLCSLPQNLGKCDTVS